MKAILKKQFVQNVIIEVAADLLMVCGGVLIAYYLKLMMW